MDIKADSKRKKDKQSDYEDRRKEKKSRRYRSRSRSDEDRNRESRRKRRHSRSRSPNVPLKQEKRQEDTYNKAPAEKEAPARKAKETDMLNTRTGGAYIPPARLRMMQAQITDKASVAYQRLAWEALKKSIHGHINKINVGNIGIIIKELLKENIVRGRGLLCRSVIQAQAASPTFTNVYAALVAAVNSRFPNIGELLLKRLVIQFKRGFKRNDKSICISSASFIAHLVNQRVAHEILALELLTLLVESPTDDSVEVAIAFLKECGQKLTEVSSKGVNAIFEMLRNILHEGQLDKRVQYMIEVMFQVWKDGFKDHPALIEELELVPEEEQFTHLLMLDDATDPQDILNVFKFDEKYEDNELKYKTLSKEILGSDAESGEEDGSEESGSEDSDDEEEQEGEQKGMTIIDNTETNLVALRRTIYLTINSSLDFEECAHKLMKMQLKPGQEVELCHMFLDCCAEQRTYEKFYGLLAQRFCNINRMYIGPFEEIFKDSYATAHRLDTNRLRNVSKFFAHLLFTDSISWEVMECVKLNEEDTTSSSRIYIKILYQELAEYMGLKKLNDRLKDPTLQVAFSGIFPRDNPKNTRFSINFFTSIGLGGLTDELREHLKQMPKNVPAPVTDINVESESSSDSSSSSSSSDSSDSSSSDEEGSRKDKKNKKSKEKEKSKQNSDSINGEASNKAENDINKDRWGHDGFYNTYGDDARRYENRPERSEQSRENFARPRDVSRRTDDRKRENENRNKDDRHTREGEKRRNDKDSRDEGLRDNRKESDNRADRERERRKDSAGDRRSERHTKYDSRYDNEKHSRDRNTRHEKIYEDVRKSRDGDRLDREKRRDRDEDSNNKSNRDYDDKNRDRNAERDRRDKGSDKNDTLRKDRFEELRSNRDNDDRSRDRNLEREKRDKANDMNDKEQRQDRSVDRYNRNDKDRTRDRSGDRGRREKDNDKNNTVKDTEDLSRKTGNKNMRNYEKKTRVTEKTSNRENDSNVKGKRNKHKNNSDEDDSRSQLVEEKRNDKRKEDENRSKKTEDRNHRVDKSKKCKDDRNEKKKKSKKDKRNYNEESESSTEESESETDDSDNDNKNGGRYWDTFDIENRETVAKDSKANEKRTSKIKEKGKRRER